MATESIAVEVGKNEGLCHAAVKGDQRVARRKNVPNPDPDHVPNTDKGVKVAVKAGASASVWDVGGWLIFLKSILGVYITAKHSAMFLRQREEEKD